MAIMEPSNQRQNKKRHSKPCKFYQMNNCPYSEEECDFAHIITGEPTFQNATPCRFYIKGHCSNGLWCRYKHSLERGTDVNDPRALRSPDIRDIEPELTQQALRRHSGKPTSPRRTDRSPDSRTPLPPYTGAYPTSPRFHAAPASPTEGYGLNNYVPSWRPNVPTSPPMYGLERMHIGSPPTSDSLSNFGPSPASSVSDEAPLVKGSRSPTRAQAPSELSPTLPSIHQAYMVAHPGAIGSPYSVTSPTFIDDGSNGSWPHEYALQAALPPPGLPKNKAVNYKTKLCRFFKPDRPCPNGDTCTFIHNVPEGMPKQTSPTISPGISLPSKPVSLKEANHQRGYYPVGWRVIGGGVPLSQEASSSSESTSSSFDESLESWEGTTVPAAPQIPASLSRRNKTSAAPLKIDVASLPPVTFRQANDNASTPTRTMTPKLRPTSTPPTPSATHVNIMSLFNAESPAIL